MRLLFAILFLSSAASAVSDTFGRSRYAAPTADTSTLRRPLRNWSLVIPSFVIHGMRPTAEASSSMPRKMDKNGDSVMTPGLGVKYEGPNGDLFVAGLIKDCYDHLAGTLQYGFHSRISKLTNWGLTFGVYIRETPFSCETTNNGFTRTTECQPMDEYDLKFDGQVNHHALDIIPMPFFHFSTALYKDQDLQINFKLMSNILLNEFGFSVPF